MRLGFKLFLVLAMLGMVILGSLGTIYYYQMSRFGDIENLERSKVVAQNYASHINAHLEEVSNIVLSMTPANIITDSLKTSNSDWDELSATVRNEKIETINQEWIDVENDDHPLVVERTTNKIASYFKEHQKLFPGFYGEIFLTNKHGVMIASTGRLTTLAHRHKYWWQASYDSGKGKIFIDDRGYDTSVGDYVTGVVLPVMEDNEVIGILKANVVVSTAFSAFLQDYEDNYDGEIQLVRTRGLIVFQKGIEPLSQEVDVNLLDYLSKRKSGSARILGEKANYIGFAPVSITLGSDAYAFGGNFASIDQIKGNLGEAWHIIVSPDETEMISIKEETKNYIFYTSIFMLASVGLAILVFSKLIVQPIVDLSGITSKFGKGDRSQRAKVVSSDEIGQLSKNFNIMAQNLESLYENLEKKVAQRTAVLKKANKRLDLQKQKITKLNNALRIITKTLRHDLANVFVHVNLSLELLKEKPKDESSLKEISKSAKHGIDIINQMRTLESLLTRKISLEAVNLNNIFKKIIKNYKIKFNITGKASIKANGALKSVVDNIISNAIKHGQTDRMDIEIKSKEDKIQIKFIDYGKGIPKKIKSKIFKEGFKYGEAAGSGLGLYIVEQTIERYGGRIWVEDNKPQGVIFIIELKK